PEAPHKPTATFNFTINGESISYTKQIVYKINDPVKGEVYKPFEIVPEVSAKISEKVFIFDSDQQKDIPVIVKAGRDNLEGFVQMAYPNDWSVYPDKQKLDIKHKGEEQVL